MKKLYLTFFLLISAILLYFSSPVSADPHTEWACKGTVALFVAGRDGVKWINWPFDIRYAGGKSSGIKGEQDNSCKTHAIAAAKEKYGERLAEEPIPEKVTITSNGPVPQKAIDTRNAQIAAGKNLKEYYCKVYTKWQARHLSGEKVRYFPDSFTANSDTQAWANAIMRQEAEIKKEPRFAGFKHNEFGFSSKNGKCWEVGKDKPSAPIDWPRTAGPW